MIINSPQLLGPEEFITTLVRTSKISSTHTQIPSLFEVHFDVLVPSSSISANLFLSLSFYTANLYASDASYVCYPSHNSRFEFSYNSW